jgi:hypothetical protein
MKIKLLRDMQHEAGHTVPKGAEIEHPDAWWHVRMGTAEPADDECRVKAAMTPEQMRAAQHAYERANRGILPRDFAAFDRGEIAGYAPDGSVIPGPAAE